jgi:hypothetical protein
MIAAGTLERLNRHHCFRPPSPTNSPTAVDGIVSRARVAEIDGRFFTKRCGGA